MLVLFVCLFVCLFVVWADDCTSPRASNPQISADHSNALRAHDLTPFMGDDAPRQPADLKDLMLHETAVAWLTARLKVTVPAKPWEESAQLFGSRVQQAAEYVNTHYDVDALQMELPARLQTLIAREGGRIGK